MSNSFDGDRYPDADAELPPIVVGPLPLRLALGGATARKNVRTIVEAWVGDARVARTDHAPGAAGLLTQAPLGSIGQAYYLYRAMPTADGGVRGVLVALLPAALRPALEAVARAAALDDPAEPWRASAAADEFHAGADAEPWRAAGSETAEDGDDLDSRFAMLPLGVVERLARDRVHPGDDLKECVALLERVFSGCAIDAQEKRDAGTIDDFLKTL